MNAVDNVLRKYTKIWPRELTDALANMTRRLADQAGEIRGDRAHAKDRLDIFSAGVDELRYAVARVRANLTQEEEAIGRDEAI